MFATVIHFQPSLMFTSKADLIFLHRIGLSSGGELLALHSNLIMAKVAGINKRTNLFRK